jgi:chorismate mutase
MTRGVRGATTVAHNEAELIFTNTKLLVEEMIEKNNITPEIVSHVFISVTNDINAGFPARAVREIPSWSLVPVMCMKEIEVPNSLEKCIRIMMVIQTNKAQDEIKHIFQNDAVQLRPDLIRTES